MADITPAEASMRAIQDPREREAIQLLHTAGWSTRELGMVFECDKETIARIVREP